MYLPLTRPLSSFDFAILVFAVPNGAIIVSSPLNRLCVYYI